MTIIPWEVRAHARAPPTSILYNHHYVQAHALIMYKYVIVINNKLLVYKPHPIVSTLTSGHHRSVTPLYLTIQSHPLVLLLYTILTLIIPDQYISSRLSFPTGYN